VENIPDTMNEDIKQMMNSFQPITLKEMESVKLLNRIDTKYVINKEFLPVLLQTVAKDYRVLEIDNSRMFAYSSLYYDTPNDTMYLAHHNGKPSRYKIRYRRYEDSGLCFLEVKYKTKGRTIKNRTKINDIETSISEASKLYISKYTPFENADLEPKVYTNFSRITIVSNSLTERITLDLNLSFSYNEITEELKDIAIIELKRDGANTDSLLEKTLGLHRIFPQGFSKYCIGRAMVENNIKRNNFKERILTINKINNGK
jgi:hypothetical protein